ncbi:MAG TPA: hypothetical protein VFT60_12050, partial [Bryobacteraceae bacterium]|nr:hypothetical protein [Bryobacteraceae bacterium]
TAISSSQPLTIRWTGGNPDSLVRFSISASSPSGTSESRYTYAHAGDGSLTIPPLCAPDDPLNSEVCSLGSSDSPNLSISIQVMPDPAKKGAITAPGVTGPVFLSWSYAWQFPSLVLTP